ncbi:MBL fold metallo-hydrolase [Halobacillus fulvus]|nr:MBL fold metallo-hydrolase [Halobacillus fulvus]
MRVTKVKHLYQLSFMPRSFPVNCYLIEENDHLVLIDTALPYSKKAILQTAEKIGKPITKILLTHAHSDHIGALDGLKQELPGAEVFMTEREAKLLTGDSSLEEGETLPIKGGVPKNVHTRPDRLIQAGERIGSLLTVPSPGHTPGSMCFLDTRDHHLIAGDAFQTRGGVAVSGDLRWRFPFPALATWNKEAAIDSAGTLIACNPSLLAVGHGTMISDPVSVMENAQKRAIARRDKRVTKSRFNSGSHH